MFKAVFLSAMVLVSQSIGQSLIHDKVDENHLVTLAGNTRPEANAANDLGPVANSLSLDHMLLQLKRSPEQEQAAAQFVEDLSNPKSANFHKWISASEFGQKFGLAEEDIQTISGWLESHGFMVNSVYPSGMVIDFSGSAGQVSSAFHTSIHNLDVQGVRHIANMSDPQIPAALAPAVAGVVSLHDFQPHPMVKRSKYTYSEGRSSGHAVVPADLATIYDFNSLFTKGISGQGQTVAVLEDTDLYTTADWNTFRSTFGLSQYTAGSLVTSHPAPPSGVNNCIDPGVNPNGDDIEATLDAEYASAAAPSATIVLAACANTRTSYGQYIAMANMVNGSNPPSVMSISYGICEAENGASANAAISSLYMQAVTEGISIFVSAGDENAASCDADGVSATHGIGVNGWASTIYNVAVGGTDFSDTLDGTSSTYWATTNSGTYGSALSYIPEIPWNSSCASGLLVTHFGFTTAYGEDGFCNSTTGLNGYLVVAGGSGGPSNCFTGASTMNGVSDGSCKGLAKPSWQTGAAGNPSDGVRDIPDVSLFAANETLDGGAIYIFCFSDLNNDGSRCVGAPSNWAAAGGTSFAAPILAGIQALVNQNAGAAQGNPNPVYYGLAAGAKASSIFHTVTRGDIDVNCTGTVDCFGTTGEVGWGRDFRGSTSTISGALSVSSSSFTPAYSTGSAWSFATGLGSVDVFNLVTNWSNQ
ncbi:MAG: S53 family peptidase [Bryobacteraceae bacterium]